MYILNTRKKVAHKDPSMEVCNADSIPRRFREKSDVIPSGYRRCGHCFKASD